MSQNAGALKAEEQCRVDAIWGLVEGVVAPPLAVPAASSSDGPKAAADAAQPAAPDPMVEEHEAGVPLWAGPSDAWADLAFDRVQMQEQSLGSVTTTARAPAAIALLSSKRGQERRPVAAARVERGPATASCPRACVLSSPSSTL